MIEIIPPPRTSDKHGEGHFGAPRGSRTHNGIDLACYGGSLIKTPHHGRVTKIGYPYPPNDPKKGFLRYVQVEEKNGHRCRYFYVAPSVRVGDLLKPGDTVGTAQGLLKVYPGITDHIHYEVIKDGEYIDPVKYLENFNESTT